MSKKLKILPFLLAAPLLFMANSSAESEPYKGFSVEVVSYNYEKNDLVYVNDLKLNVNNTGAGYLNLDSLVAIKGNRHIYGAYADLNGFQGKYGELLLPPNESNSVEYDLTITSSEEFDFDGATFTYQAFTQFEKIEGTDYKIELSNREVTDYDLYTYTFKISGLTGFEHNYHYSGIIDFTAKDTHLAVHAADFERKSVYFRINTYEDLKEEDFTFHALYKIKGGINHSAKTLETVRIALITLGIIVGSFVVAGGSVGIFFAVEGANRRKKRLNQKSWYNQ